MLKVKLICAFAACVCGFYPLAAVAQTFRYQDESGNIFFVEKLSDIPEKYRSQVIPPTPLPYRNERERRKWMKEQKKLAKEQGAEEDASDGNRVKMGKAKNIVGKKGGKGEESVRQVESVEIYISPSCSDCPKLEKFLKQKRIKYRKYDIVKDQKAFEKFDQLGAGSRLPVTKIGSRVIKGLQTDAIFEAATQAKIAKDDSSVVGSL